jgi:hypothetical protein
MSIYSAGRSRCGFVNVKLLFVCLIIAGVGVWYFYVREGSKGVPTSIEDLKKENPFVEKQPATANPDDTADPLGGSAPAQEPALSKQEPGKIISEPMPPKPPINEPVTSKLQTPPKSTRPTREVTLEGKWLASWSDGVHKYAVEWELKSDGTAFGKRTQNGNPIRAFPFKWYVADDVLVTEVGKTKAQFRHHSIDPNSFELTILSGVAVAPGQSRTMLFNRSH